MKLTLKENIILTDLDLQLVPASELTMEMFDPDAMAPDIETTEKPRMPRVSIVQSTSADAIAAGARPGQYEIDWNDPTKPAIYVNSLRVWLLDKIEGRVMFPFKDDGKPDRSTKEPWCASSDGLKPRDSDMFQYVGKTYTDWRNKESVTIEPDCEACPLQKFQSYKDANGKLVNQSPPCQKAPQFVLWLVDQKFAAIFQSSAPTVRNRLVGQPRKGHPGLQKFFLSNGVDPGTERNTYPNIKEGEWFSVKLTSKLETHGSGNQTYVPIVELDNVPLAVTDLKFIFDIKGLYEKESMRDVLSGQVYSSDYEADDGEGSSRAVRLTPPGMDGAKKLGNGGGRRRMGESKPVENESVEAGDDAY